MVDDKQKDVEKPKNETWVCEWDNVHGDIIMFTTPKPKENEPVKIKENGKV